MKRLFAVAALCAAWIGVGAARAQDAPLPAENRWAILIDATVKAQDDATNKAREEARGAFCDALVKSGIPEDHVFVYTENAADEARRATRANIMAVLDALRDVNDKVQLDPEGAKSRYWRSWSDDDDLGPCEVQLYIVGGGVSDVKDGKTRNFLAPCDASVAELDGAYDERLIDVATIEEVLFEPEGLLAIDRFFLSVNFWSTETARGAGNEATANLNDVDLSSVGTRGAGDEDDAEKIDDYCYVYLLTRDARFDDATVDSFYKTLADGLEGCADFASDNNGWVEAYELVKYVQDNVVGYVKNDVEGAEDNVQLRINGTARYTLAKATREAEPVQAELFEEIANVMTKEENKAYKDSAMKRAARIKGLELETETETETDAEAKSSDGAQNEGGTR